jgi:hypothetical protein
LDLSNCCLSRVPPVLARLPHLTALTLNENDGLNSGSALAPLAALTGLHTLEMRECGLTSVPRAVTALTNLRCLLLGYNAMTEVRLLAWAAPLGGACACVRRGPNGRPGGGGRGASGLWALAAELRQATSTGAPAAAASQSAAA